MADYWRIVSEFYSILCLFVEKKSLMKKKKFNKTRGKNLSVFHSPSPTPIHSGQQFLGARMCSINMYAIQYTQINASIQWLSLSFSLYYRYNTEVVHHSARVRIDVVYLNCESWRLGFPFQHRNVTIIVCIYHRLENQLKEPEEKPLSLRRI